jgi:hypothetical protein
MTVTALDPSSALVIIDLQNAIVGAPTVPYTGPEVVARAVELARAFHDAALVAAGEVEGELPVVGVSGPAQAACAARSWPSSPG